MVCSPSREFWQGSVCLSVCLSVYLFFCLIIVLCIIILYIYLLNIHVRQDLRVASLQFSPDMYGHLCRRYLGSMRWKLSVYRGFDPSPSCIILCSFNYCCCCCCCCCRCCPWALPSIVIIRINPQPLSQKDFEASFEWPSLLTVAVAAPATV